MAFTKTLHEFESEYGPSESSSPAKSSALADSDQRTLEETKVGRQVSHAALAMQRKMTIDYNDKTVSDKAEVYQATASNTKPLVDLTSEGDRSQLTVETELMEPLASADFILPLKTAQSESA